MAHKTLLETLAAEKMPRLIFILVLFGSYYSCVVNDKEATEKDNSSVNTIGKEEARTTTNVYTDTVFIYKAKNKHYYHAIYIDTNKQSKQYARLTNFTFGEYHQRSYDSNKKAIIEREPGIFKSHKAIDLPQYWLPLYPYNDKYYLYAPSDWGNAGRRIVKNNELIFWYMDGPFPVPITEFNQIDKHKYKLTTINVLNPDAQPVESIIQILDLKTNLALFQTSELSGQMSYQLYIPLEQAKNYDLIVNYCNESKQMEYDFDKIDYNKILRSR